MSKSTIVVIFVIYVVSIIAIGFFGMSIKVYDKVKYIDDITMTAQAEDPSMFAMDVGVDDYDQPQPKDPLTGYNQYDLTIFFSKHLVDEHGKNYIALTLLPHITYDSGDVAGQEESIVYTLELGSIDEEAVTLDKYGVLRCYEEFTYFLIYVTPEKKAKTKVGALIRVFVSDL